jgi:hypothetical protein
MDEHPKLPHYDPDYCLKMTKWAACVCLGIMVLELLTLLFVTPNNGCPGWTIFSKDGSGIPAWILVSMLSGAPTILIFHIVLRWDQKWSQEFYDRFAYGDDNPSIKSMFPNIGFGSKPTLSPDKKHESRELNFEKVLLQDANTSFLLMSMAICAICILPLLLMVGECTYAARFFGV